MASRERTRVNKKVSSKKWSPQPVTPQPHPAALTQQARLDPGSLVPGDMLHIQRTLGNQAVGRVLAQRETLGYEAIKRKPGPAVGQNRLQRFSDQQVKERAWQLSQENDRGSPENNYIEAKIQVRAHELSTGNMDSDYYRAKQEVERAWSLFQHIQAGGLLASAGEWNEIKVGLSTEDYNQAKTSMAQRFLQRLRNAEDGPLTYNNLLLQCQGNHDAVNMLNEANGVITHELNQLRQNPEIVYGQNPLTLNEGRTIIDEIEHAKFDVAHQLNLQNQNGPYNLMKSARTHEWGLGRARNQTGEIFLVIGDKTGVTWGPFLPCLTPLAHSHPYFEEGKVRNRYNQVSQSTKEIANHPNLPSGAILWNSLATRADNDAKREISKIFPSASDIAFTGEKNLSVHTVYTTYICLTHPQQGLVIANPNFQGGQFARAPQLRFEISNVQLYQNDNYQCTLTAFNGNIQIWQAQVTTNGTGQFGLLNW